MDGLVYKSRFIGPACFINVDGNIVRLVKPSGLVYKSRFIRYVCILYNIIYWWCKHEPLRCLGMGHN